MPLTAESAARKDKTNAGNATFEHRHFASLANMLACMPVRWGQRRYDIAKYFAGELAQTNPRFDHERFMRACGFEV